VADVEEVVVAAEVVVVVAVEEVVAKRSTPSTRIMIVLWQEMFETPQCHILSSTYFHLPLDQRSIFSYNTLS